MELATLLVIFHGNLTSTMLHEALELLLALQVFDVFDSSSLSLSTQTITHCNFCPKCTTKIKGS